MFSEIKGSSQVSTHASETWNFWQNNRFASIQSNLNFAESMKDSNLAEFLSERTENADLIKEAQSTNLNGTSKSSILLRNKVLDWMGEQQCKI